MKTRVKRANASLHLARNFVFFVFPMVLLRYLSHGPDILSFLVFPMVLITNFSHGSDSLVIGSSSNSFVQ